MLTRIRVFALLLLACLAPSALAQIDAPAPEVEMAEVYRRGDSVTVTGEGPRSAEADAFAAAVAPPADDSHKWFVVVWWTENCAPCEKLKADFRSKPELLAYVAQPSLAGSWAHYIEYHGEDQTQRWRRDRYRLQSYPTVIVQPPRNGMWGPAGKVVFYKAGYSGDSMSLSREMSAAIRQYVTVMSRKGYPLEPHELIRNAEEQEEDKPSPGAGQTPPFADPPPVSPFEPNAQFPFQPNNPNPAVPQIPPVSPVTLPELPGLGMVLGLMKSLLVFVFGVILFVLALLATLSPLIFIGLLIGGFFWWRRRSSNKTATEIERQIAAKLGVPTPPPVVDTRTFSTSQVVPPQTAPPVTKQDLDELYAAIARDRRPTPTRAARGSKR